VTNKALVDVVIQVASSINKPLALNIIKALGERHKTSGQETYLIYVSWNEPFRFGPTLTGQSSFATLFSPEAGWRYGQAKDTDSLFEREKELAAELEYHPVREVQYHLLYQTRSALT
jgi:hypothetical protein